MKYEVIFKKYWNDNNQTTEKKHFNTIRELLEYVYSVYENSINYNRSFQCKGNRKWCTGFLNANYSLQNDGDLWLMRITYINTDRKKIIVFDKNKRFCSEKISNAFDAFSEIVAENREVYGEIE